MTQEEIFYKLIVDISVASEKAVQQLKELQQQTEKAAGSLEKELPKGTEATEKGFLHLVAAATVVATVLRKVMDAAGALAQRLRNFVSFAVETAARIEEMTLVLGLMGERIGVSDTEMQQLIESVKELGITTSVAQDLIAQLIRYEIDLSHATALARTAQDAAVLSMSDSSETLERLIYGITTQNTRVIRQTGLMINLRQALEDYGKTLGKTLDELSAQERVQATLQAVLEEGVRVQGAYETAMLSASKQLRSMKRYIEEVAEAVGVHLKAAWSDAVFAIVDFVKWLREATSQGGELYPVLERIGETLQELGQTALPAVLGGLQELIIGFLSLLDLLTSLVKGFTELEPALQKGILAFVGLQAVLGTLGVLVPLVTKALGILTLAVKAMTGPLGLLSLAIGGLVIAYHKLREAEAAAAEEAAKYEEVYSRQKRALLETARGAEDYAQKVLALPGALERVERSIERTGIAYWDTLRYQEALAEETARLQREFLVHNSTLNIAVAGLRHWIEAEGEAGAAARKFGDAIVVVAEKAAEAARETFKFSEEFRKNFVKVAQDAAKELLKDLTAAYKKIIDIQNEHNQAAVLAEKDYLATRALLVEAGLDEEIKELDESYAQKQALAERDHEVALRMAELAKNEEIRLAKAAFGEKLTVWLTEQMTELEVNKETMAAVLAVIAAKTGSEVALEYQAFLNILDIIEKKEAGWRGYQQFYLQWIEDQLSATMAYIEGMAQVMAGKPIDFDALFADIPGIGDRAAAQLGKEGRKVEKSAEEVVADIAQTLERLFTSIAKIMETLSRELPSLPKLTVQKWLDQLLALTQEMAEWLGAPERNLKAFIEWFYREFVPLLEQWDAAAKLAASLFGSLAKMLEIMAEESPKIVTSVSMIFERLYELTREASSWITGQGQEFRDFVAWFDKELRPLLVKWAESAAPLADVLDSGVSIFKALAERIPRFRTSVSEFFDRLEDVFRSVQQAYVDLQVELEDPRPLVLADEVRRWLEKVAEGLEKVVAVLEAGRQIFDVLAEEIPFVERSFRAFMWNLRQLVEEINWYFDPRGWGILFRFEPLADVIVTYFEDLRESLEPLLDLVDLSVALFLTLDQKWEFAGRSFRTFMSNLLALVQEVNWYFDPRGWGIVFRFAPLADVIVKYFESLADSLRPLADLLGITRDIFDNLSEKLPERRPIAEFFEALGALIQEVNDWVAEIKNWLWTHDVPRLLPELSKDAQEWLEQINKTIGPLANVVTSIASMFDALAATKIPSEIKIDIFVQRMAYLLEQVIEVFQSLSGYVEALGEEAENIIMVAQGAADVAATAVQVIADLMYFEYRAPPGPATINQVALRIRWLLEETIKVLIGLADLVAEMGQDADKIIDVASGVAGVAADALQFLTNLLELRFYGFPSEAFIQEAADRFEHALILFIEALQNVAAQFEDLGAEAGQMAANAESIVSIAESAVGMIFDFARLIKDEARLPSIGEVATLVSRIEYFILEIAKIPEKIDESLIEGAAEKLAILFEPIGAALDALFQLLEIQLPGRETINAFVDAVHFTSKQFIEMLDKLEYKTVHFLDGVSWHSLGVDLMQGLIEGIYSMMDELDTALGDVADMLPHSLAKTGPLAQPVNWTDTLRGNLDAALADIASRLPPRVGVAGGGSALPATVTNYNLTYTALPGTGYSNPKRLFREMETARRLGVR